MYMLRVLQSAEYLRYEYKYKYLYVRSTQTYIHSVEKVRHVVLP